MRGISHQYIDGRITLAMEKRKLYMLHLNHPPPGCLLAVFRSGSVLSLQAPVLAATNLPYVHAFLTEVLKSLFKRQNSNKSDVHVCVREGGGG
jgi:hypothetical protein